MNKLLINERPLQLSPSLACVIGVNEAIFLQHLNDLLKTSSKEIEGRDWICKTYKDWSEIDFKFWRPNTVMRIVKSLADKGLIEVAALSDDKRDRISYYTINYSALSKECLEALK